MQPLRALKTIRSGLLAFCLWALACATPVNGAEDSQAAQNRHGPHSTYGVHGMVLFGEQTLFASHLPLYHHPHDRQIVLPVQFQNPADAEAFARWRQHYTELITLVPQPFELAKLAPDAAPFLHTVVADIYQGRFEQGGNKQFAGITLQLERPVIYRPLSAEGARPAQANFWLLKGDENSYLVYQIGPRPDQDLIVAIGPTGLCEQTVCEVSAALAPGATLSLPDRVLLTRVATGASETVKVLRTVYRELADLAQ